MILVFVFLVGSAAGRPSLRSKAVGLHVFFQNLFYFFNGAVFFQKWRQEFSNGPLPFPDVAHSDGKLDAGVVREELDVPALLGIGLVMEGVDLLVDGVHSLHEFLSSPRILRLHNHSRFHSGVDLVFRNQFEEYLHRFQQNFCLFEIIIIDLGECLSEGCFDELLGRLVDDGAPLVLLEALRVRLDNDSTKHGGTEFGLTDSHGVFAGNLTK